MIQKVDIPARVVASIFRTPSVVSLRVALDGPVDFLAGQWGLVKLGVEKELGRPLSISNAPTEKGFLEFTKKITGSAFSRALLALKVGDTVQIRYPFGKFTFSGDVAKIAFISGGIGITPIRGILKDLTDKGIHTSIVLLYGSNSLEEIAFKDDLDEMQSKNPNLKVVHVLRSAPETGNWCTRLICEDLIQKEIPDYRDRRFFLCGPPAMVQAFKGILAKDFGLPPAQVVTEDFTGY